MHNILISSAVARDPGMVGHQTLKVIILVWLALAKIFENVTPP